MLFPALVSLAAEQTRAVVRRNLRAYTLYGAAAAAVVGAIAYGLDALRIQLGSAWGAIYADLAIAAGLLAFAAILAIFGMIARRKPKTNVALSAATAVGVPLALDSMSRRYSPSLVLIGAALVGGVLFGRSATKR